MPVDRSDSGIRVSGRAEMRRPTQRFPVQIPSKMSHRRSSARAAAWRPKHARRTRQIGRVRPQPTAADLDVLPPQVVYRPIHRKSRRRPVRSLTVALLLAAATVAGVGMAAWAIGAAPDPLTGVPGGSGPTRSAVPDDQNARSAEASAFQPTNRVDRPGTAGSTRVTAPGTQLSGAQLPAALPSPARSAPPSDPPLDGPAVVSTLAPGDPGFGWPASAFGSAAP